ncbi:MAG: spiro-SPASM protein, partial [Treponema sp.]|nr:spiro-SPASM protein [Treponema sp.]
MKNLVILFAGMVDGNHLLENVFDGKCAFDLSLEWALSQKNSVKTVVLLNSTGESEKIIERIDANSQKAQIAAVTKDAWTAAVLIEQIAVLCEEYKADYALFSWADCPFLSSKLTDELVKTHEEYKAEYTFADGYPYGLAPEVIDKGAARIIGELAGNNEKYTATGLCRRDAVFSVMSGDINSFEIETILSPKDYRLFRFEFEASSNAGLMLCKNVFDAAKAKNITADSNLDPVEFSDLASKTVGALKTLPHYYNIQISPSYNTKSLYNPYDKLFAGKTLPQMKLEDFKNLVKKISDFSETAVVSLSCFGEALLNPDFLNMAKEVLSYPGLSLLVEGDGLLITEEIARELSEYSNRVYWIICLDAANSEMYQKINGLGADEFSRAVASVSLLHKYFKGNVYPQFTRMKENEEQLEAFYRFWKEKENPSGGQLIIQKYDNLAGLLPEQKPADLSPLERNECWHIRRDMVILSDGSVPVCRARADEILGNAFTEELPEIWAKLDKEVEAHIARNYCKKCGGCDEY